MYEPLHSFGTKSLHASASALAQIYYSLTGTRGAALIAARRHPPLSRLIVAAKRVRYAFTCILLSRCSRKVAGGNPPEREAECEKGYFIHQVPNIQPQSSSNCEVNVKHCVHLLTKWFLFFESTSKLISKVQRAVVTELTHRAKATSFIEIRPSLLSLNILQTSSYTITQELCGCHCTPCILRHLSQSPQILRCFINKLGFFFFLIAQW